MRWWCKELGCTESELRAAVQAVGVMVKDVRKHRKPPVQPRVSAIKKGGTVAT